MSENSRSVPSATSVLAESVRRYRRGFPGVARAFLPVFAVFAIGQIGLALWGEADTFGGLLARAGVLAGVGILEIVSQLLATGGVIASSEDLPRASARSIYRRGARVFWPTAWVAILAALAFSVAPVVARLVSPYLIRLSGTVSMWFFGGSYDVAVTVALGAVAGLAIVVAILTLVLLEKLVFALVLVSTGVSRGLRALEMSAGLSEGRSWLVGSRLAAGFAATALVLAPFVMVLAATAAPNIAISASPWAWSLFAAGYLLAAIPFCAIFLGHLTEVLRDTAAEKATARESRPWVRWLVWAGAAAWAVIILRGLIG